MTDDWQWRPFEDCIDRVEYTKKIQRTDFLDQGAFPIVSQEDGLVNGYWDDERDLFKTHRPIVVFGDHTRAFKYVDFDFVLGADGVKILQPRPFLLPRFFFYQLHTADLSSLDYARHYRLLKELQIGFPSLAEQQRIVSILDEAFERMATAKTNAERNLANARALFESYAAAVFARAGDDWSETTIGAEVELIPGFAFRSAQYTNKEASVKLLRGDNIIPEALRWDDVKRWPASDTSDYHQYQLRSGDIVLAMDRPWVKAGLKHAMISEEDLPCLLVQRTARLRARSGIDGRFLMCRIGSADFTTHILGKLTGIGVPHISGQQIKDFVFLKPPVKEQQRIADSIYELRERSRELESNYSRKLDALDALKQSLLHQAFTGQL